MLAPRRKECCSSVVLPTSFCYWSLCYYLLSFTDGAHWAIYCKGRSNQASSFFLRAGEVKVPGCPKPWVNAEAENTRIWKWYWTPGKDEATPLFLFLLLPSPFWNILIPNKRLSLPSKKLDFKAHRSRRICGLEVITAAQPISVRDFAKWTII